MDDMHQILIDLIFRPLDPDLKLHPEEIQLLLSYIGEILKEIEAEENIATNEAHHADNGGLLPAIVS